jgi:hypothetical protein
MKNKFFMALALGASLCSMAISPADGVTLTFDELTTRPVQGLTTNGTTFGFTVGTQTSQDAVYNRPAPAGSGVLSGAVLEGDARGVLTLTFPTSTPVLSFGVALTAPSDLIPGLTVQLLGPGAQALGTQPLNTSRQGTLTEARFDFSGALLGQAVIDFNDVLLSSPQRFAIDNLTVLPGASLPGGGTGGGGTVPGGTVPGSAVPTPSGIALIGIGLLALGASLGRPGWRRLLATSGASATTC